MSREPADMEPVERDLRRLADAVEWPDADLATSVGAELRAGRRVRRPLPRVALWPRRRVVALVVAALLVVTGTAVAARLALGSITIDVVPELSSPTAARSPRHVLGTAVSLDEARAEVGFSVVVPVSSELGPPDGVFVGSAAGSPSVSLTWAANVALARLDGTQWGVVLMEFPEGDPGSVVKQVVPATGISTVHVGSARAYWIEGQHQLLLPNGDVLRLDGSVLVWERDGITLRLESHLPRAAAIRLAEKVGEPGAASVATRP
jgi:hypothetical protein